MSHTSLKIYARIINSLHRGFTIASYNVQQSGDNVFYKGESLWFAIDLSGVRSEGYVSALFGFNSRSGVRDVTTPVPDYPLSLPYEFRSEMNWLDFSGTSNPLGTPKSFIRAIHTALVDGELNYIPDKNAYAFRTSLARHFGLSPESFLAGASVADMIRAAAQTYQPCRVGVFSPVPAEYMLSIENAGHEVLELSSPHGFVVPDAQSVIKEHGNFQAAVLANPTYPTSRLLSTEILMNYLEHCAWVIVDEHLIELTLGGESVVPLTERYSNLIVIRSMSSIFAMPGIPISYCIAHPQTISHIERFFDPSNISMFAEVLGDCALSEGDYMEQTHEFLDAEIPWMQCMLNLIPGIHIFPAEANFVMCSFENNDSMDLAVSDTAELVLRLQLAGFLVRELGGMPGIDCGKYFCVAVRKREDNEKLLAALREIIVRIP